MIVAYLQETIVIATWTGVAITISWWLQRPEWIWDDIYAWLTQDEPDPEPLPGNDGRWYMTLLENQR